MAFTYDPSNATDKDVVRFKLDDTVETSDSLQDETIEAELARSGSLTGAILSCGQVLYMKLLKKSKRSELGSQKREYGDRARDLKALLDEWAKNGIPGLNDLPSALMSAGEISKPDLTTYKLLNGGGIEY